jgi:hypothetical protein
LKKLTAIFFLTVYLFATTEAKQLLKLPVVFEHYAEHKQDDKQMTMLKFLSIHYLHGSPRDKDYDRDMKLPFKTSGDCISTVSSDIIPVTFQFSIVNPIEISLKPIFIHTYEFILSSFPSTIWQPPKSC